MWRLGRLGGVSQISICLASAGSPNACRGISTTVEDREHETLMASQEFLYQGIWRQELGKFVVNLTTICQNGAKAYRPHEQHTSMGLSSSRKNFCALSSFCRWTWRISVYYLVSSSVCTTGVSAGVPR